MKVRLGFAVAAHLDPEILIIDEVLAVGDFEFQRKCLGKMKDVSQEGRTVLFVSHNLPLVQGLCPTSILLENGQIKYAGDTQSTINHYLKESHKSEVVNSVKFSSHGFIGEIAVENASYEHKQILRIGDDLLFKIKFTSPETVKNLNIGIGIHKNQECITKLHTFHQLNELINVKEGETAEFEILWKNNYLVAGNYEIEFSILRANKGIFNLRDLFTLEMTSHDFYGNGQLPKPHMGFYLAMADWSYKIYQ